MQSLIERAMVNEDSDIDALRELAVAESVEGSEPTPRVMCDGGVPRPTAGWRSPLGGPRYEGVQSPEDPRVDEWREGQIEREIRIRGEARAVAGPEPQGSSDDEPEDDGLRADGSGDSHAERIAEQLAMADEEDLDSEDGDDDDD